MALCRPTGRNKDSNISSTIRLNSNKNLLDITIERNGIKCLPWPLTMPACWYHSFLSMTMILTVCNMDIMVFPESELLLFVIFQCCEIMIHTIIKTTNTYFGQFQCCEIMIQTITKTTNTYYTVLFPMGWYIESQFIFITQKVYQTVKLSYHEMVP